MKDNEIGGTCGTGGEKRSS